MAKSDNFETIDTSYRVVDERAASQPIIAPGGLGRLAGLIFSMFVVYLLSRIFTWLFAVTGIFAVMGRFVAWCFGS